MEINHGSMWRIGEILIQKGWIRWEQLDDALMVQLSSPVRVGEILVENGLISREKLVRALAIQAGKPFIQFSNIAVEPEVVNLVPKRMAADYHFMPLMREEDALVVAAAEPLHFVTELQLKAAAQTRHIRTILAPLEEIQRAIHYYYGAALAA